MFIKMISGNMKKIIVSYMDFPVMKVNDFLDTIFILELNKIKDSLILLQK